MFSPQTSALRIPPLDDQAEWLLTQLVSLGQVSYLASPSRACIRNRKSVVFRRIR